MAKRAKTVLNRSLKQLQAQGDLEAVLQDCCRALLEASGAARCSIMVLGGPKRELTVRWAQGALVRPYGRMRFKLGEGLCGWVARFQKPLFSLDATKDPRFAPPSRNGLHGLTRQFHPVKAILCLPLVVEGRTVGVVNLSSFSSNRRLLKAQRRLSKRFLESLSRVIAQATLLQEAEVAMARWRRLYKGFNESVAQVSHDLRSPLSLIVQEAQRLLSEEAGVPPGKRESLQLIKEKADWVFRLASDLLDLSRMEAGRMILYRQPMDLAELLRQVADSYTALILPRRLVLKLDSTPLIYGDRNRLTQVVENLLANSLKFTPPEGTVTLRLVPKGRCAEFSITDNGMGIPKREQRRLFEKFFQPALNYSLKARGAGLGLALVKETVQMHGGTVRIASEPGKGTTVIVSLPLYEPSFALTDEFRLMRERATLEGKTLATLLFKTESQIPVDWEKVRALFQRSVSREDRLLLNPSGGLVILSLVEGAESIRAIQRRLQHLAKLYPELIPPPGVQLGWVKVPEEETELLGALKRAQRRAWEGRRIKADRQEELRREEALPSARREEAFPSGMPSRRYAGTHPRRQG